MGRDGGVALAKPAAAISLRAIYDTTMGEQQVWTPRPNVPHQCIVSSNVERFFSILAAGADVAMRATLDRKSLADSLEEIKGLEASHRRAH